MDELIRFFATLPAPYRTASLVVGIALFWALEGALPRFQLRYDKLRHAGLNLFLAATVVTVGLAMSLLAVRACDLTTENRFGLLYLVELPLWLHVVAGLLLLDLVGAYAIHRIQHHVGWMWKFHLVHHTDTEVDVTTSLRQHPGETLFRISFTLLGILALGIPVGILVLYQSLSLLFAQLTHANVAVPAWADRVFSWIFVSPDMHKVHHHFERPYTNSNYGNIFSVWDRLLGTYMAAESCVPLRYGVDTHLEPEQVRGVGTLLGMPFR